MEHTRNHSPWTTSKDTVLLAWLALLWNSATNTYCPAVGKLIGSKRNTSFITLQVKLCDGAGEGWSVGSGSTGWYVTDPGVVTYQQAEMGRLQVCVCTVNMGRIYGPVHNTMYIVAQHCLHIWHNAKNSLRSYPCVCLHLRSCKMYLITTIKLNAMPTILCL